MIMGIRRQFSFPTSDILHNAPFSHQFPGNFYTEIIVILIVMGYMSIVCVILTLIAITTINRDNPFVKYNICAMGMNLVAFVDQ